MAKKAKSKEIQEFEETLNKLPEIEIVNNLVEEEATKNTMFADMDALAKETEEEERKKQEKATKIEEAVETSRKSKFKRNLPKYIIIAVATIILGIGIYNTL